jgi:hypothetical protein
MKDDWERTWKEAITSCFKILSRHSVWWHKKHHKNINQCNQSTGRDSKPIRPKYKSEASTAELACWVRPFQAYAASAMQSVMTKKLMHGLECGKPIQRQFRNPANMISYSNLSSYRNHRSCSNVSNWAAPNIVNIYLHNYSQLLGAVRTDVEGSYRPALVRIAAFQSCFKEQHKLTISCPFLCVAVHPINAWSNLLIFYANYKCHVNKDRATFVYYNSYHQKYQIGSHRTFWCYSDITILNIAS